jgi:multiple sugar transport system substrate-binding protein
MYGVIVFYTQEVSISSVTLSTVNGTKAFFLICALMLFSFAHASTLNVGVIHDNVGERENFAIIKEAFETAHPEIKLNISGYHSNTYKTLVKTWLETQTGPDVLYWYGSERLKHFARTHSLESLQDIWEQNGSDGFFSSETKAMLSVDDVPYAVPISYYPWTFFYNADVFEQLGLSPPQTWEAFLNTCERLKQANIIPINIGYKAAWPLGAWFDYLNVRLNGAAFHRQLLQGSISFTHEKVRDVFVKWKYLIDQGYFLKDGMSFDWHQPMPLMYRGLTGMTLAGQFLSPRIPAQIRHRIKMFSFPVISSASGNAVIAPSDVFMLRKGSTQQEAAKAFLIYLTTHAVQVAYNEQAGGYSPRNDVLINKNYFVETGQRILREADTLVPFFDRLAPEAFSTPAMAVMSAFMQQPDIDIALDKLETLRRKHLVLDEH